MKSIFRDEINRSAEEVLEVALHTDEVEKPDRPAELDEDIDIAVGCRLVPGSGTEDRSTRDPELIQLVPVGAQAAKYLVSAHVMAS